MAHPLLLLPGPAALAPQLVPLVAPVGHELEELPVRDVERVDPEARDLACVLLELVVPAECLAVAREPERGGPGRDADRARCRASRGRRRGLGLGNLPVMRKLVKHVGERLRVHEPVLDRHLEDQAVLEQRVRGTRKVGARQAGVDRLPHALVVALDLVQRGPCGGRLVGQAAVGGIDPEGEQLVERLVEGFAPRGAAPDQVPVEGLEVPDVEDDAVALEDRPIVEGLAANDAEQRVGAGARIAQAGLEVLSLVGKGAGRCHHGSPFLFVGSVRKHRPPGLNAPTYAAASPRSGRGPFCFAGTPIPLASLAAAYFIATTALVTVRPPKPRRTK